MAFDPECCFGPAIQMLLSKEIILHAYQKNILFFNDLLIVMCKPCSHSVAQSL